MKEDGTKESLLSLPSRERGLKFFLITSHVFKKGSLPSRERGLKYNIFYFFLSTVQSLPSRERGLKFVFVYGSLSGSCRSLRGSVD